MPGVDADAALDTMTHRGPDGRGSWSDDGVWLGHRRLSIIDGPGGGQPMVDAESGAVITYNGEIYNYVELRRELEAHGHRFRTSSDTEVLLCAYLQWGPACLSRLNGMWAFIVWDPRARRAFFSRDRFGVKPCYYAVVEDRLLIASEPKALVAAVPALGEVDRSAVADLLTDKHAHHDARSFYTRIRALAPGHYGEFGAGDRQPRITAFWRDPEPQSHGDYDAAGSLRRFSELLTDSVSIRLRSDVPVGLTLSGGIDSTAILNATAVLRAQAGAGVESYTAVYLDQPEARAADERTWARLAAGKYANASLSEVNASVDDWLGVMRKIVWHMDGPGFSPAVFPMWMIMQQARREGVPVLLEGQGADEQYGGYSHYAALAFLDRLSGGQGRMRAALQTAHAGRRSRSSQAFARDVAVALAPPVDAWQQRRSTLRTAMIDGAHNGAGLPPARHVSATGGRFERRLSADFGVNLLPPFLQYGDAISMAHSIETRLPFLDFRLVELAMSLPPAARISHGESKHILRDYLRSAGQTEIADRHDKRGYPTPAYEWLAADNGKILREQLLDRSSHVTELVDRTRLTAMIDRHVAGQYAAGDSLYALLATELWWQSV
jgi:asparagine synthase (glutamine-hydrolysing)